ncbi:MAG: hypothetical protein JWR06_1910 [Jatrophihabitans sp.]|nr:hypothetical protein [Jatrophihabitans sp.]MDT4900865.1 hypothetical protein [Pseudonocardiales bacterium]MDT4906630.1 hypothetical protein [Pseudonocardiales bacterium]
MSSAEPLSAADVEPTAAPDVSRSDDVSPAREALDRPEAPEVPSVPAAPADPSQTGAPTNERVRAAVDLLDTLRDRPLAEHPDVYQRIHAELQGALMDIDDA